MLVEYVWYRVEPARAPSFRAVYAVVAAALQDDPRCLAYEMSHDADDAELFVVRVEWSAREGRPVGLRSDPSLRVSELLQPWESDVRHASWSEVIIRSPDLPEKGLPSLYEWCGGRPALAALMDAFYDRVERDPLIRDLFPHGAGATHRAHVTAWWCEVLGGPAEYSPLGGYPRMLAHHLGLSISREQRQRFAALMSLAADDAGLPDDPEFRAAFMGYVEWGTRLAMHNSQPEAHVVRDAPMPRWGWGVAPPYVG